MDFHSAYKELRNRWRPFRPVHCAHVGGGSAATCQGTLWKTYDGILGKCFCSSNGCSKTIWRPTVQAGPLRHVNSTDYGSGFTTFPSASPSYPKNSP